MNHHGRALVIGGGPAGLMAADAIVSAGVGVDVVEAKPSLGRKLLMAGKSGLNVTKKESPEAFAAAFGASWCNLQPMLDAFGPDDVIDWAQGLGQRIFTGPTGRVFPVAMKASPLLRAWISRLESAGANWHKGWRWMGWNGAETLFETPDGERRGRYPVTVLALGGASWTRLGSDGAWHVLLRDRGVAIAPFLPANVGLRVAWSDHMAPHFGAPIKGVRWSAGQLHGRGEAIVSRHGLEGGGIYEVSAAVRDGAALTVDLHPDVSRDALAARLERAPRKASMANRLRKAARLDPVRVALLMEYGRPLPHDAGALAGLLKSLRVRHSGPNPIEQAISVAGGVRFDALSDALELCAVPGVYACGEMLDWEAPTGGYLLTACLATGRWAGAHAAARLTGHDPMRATPGPV